MARPNRLEQEQWHRSSSSFDEPRVSSEDYGAFRDQMNQMSTPKSLNRPWAKDAGHGMSPTTDVVIGFVGTFCEHVLLHPCRILRRQCQVHRDASKYHLTPITLLPVIINLQNRQGLGTLWKGIGSVFIVQGMTLLCDDALSKFTQWPKEMPSSGSLGRIFQHLLLKTLSRVIISPFYSASLVETVQSDIASEKPGVLDCIKEGIFRLISHNTTQTSRLLPIWILAVPIALHGVLYYILSCATQRIAKNILHSRKSMDDMPDVTGSSQHQTSDNLSGELTTSFVSQLVPDILLFPLETVLHRLQLQGTRTIIDNLDSGCAVIPIMTKYEGPLHCFHSIVEEEGSAGLFKGFGALILQYVLYAAVLKLSKFVVNEFKEITSKGHKGRKNL